jgi:hypothetical protein
MAFKFETCHTKYHLLLLLDPGHPTKTAAPNDKVFTSNTSDRNEKFMATL